MPIYEYRCQQCSHYLDVLQKVSDDPLKRCPACEADALKRLISAPAFRLKGGGWYETDFKSDKNKRRNLADSGEGGKSDSGGESKSGSESKSAEKSSNGGGSKSGEGSAKSGDGGGSKSGDGSAKSSSPRSGDGSQSKAAV